MLHVVMTMSRSVAHLNVEHILVFKALTNNILVFINSQKFCVHELGCEWERNEGWYTTCNAISEMSHIQLS